MISHKHKCIFIHIPKCAGSSIFKYFIDDIEVKWFKPNYDVLYGWCPDRKIHLQHASSQQLLETGLISEDIWNSYYKFTFVRNPWDRAYSDYLWIQKDCNVKGSFKDFLMAKNAFHDVLTDDSKKTYRGDHLLPQTNFFSFDGLYKMDFVGRFENLTQDLEHVKAHLQLSKVFSEHQKKNAERKDHYSHFYSGSHKKLVSKLYYEDLIQLNYHFEDKKTGFNRFKNYF